MKKQVLVTVDRGETRVAMLEASGDPAAPSKSRVPPRRRKSHEVPAGYRVAEIYFERRGGRSIVGNIYKGRVDNVLAGLEAAFVDIGLDKNGFLHVDEIVLPGVEQAKRGRGNGPRITDLLKPGQEIVVQVVKDPLEDQGRAAEHGAHDRRALHGLCAHGRGRRRLAAPGGQGARPAAQGGQAARSGRRRRDHPNGGARRHAGGFRARAAVPVQAQRRLQKRVADTPAPALVFQEADLSVRVVRDIFSEHFERAIVDDEQQHHRLVSFFSRTAPELVDRVELYEEADDPLFEAYGVDPVINGHARAPRRSAVAAAT